jgi:rare lipoprotein A
MPHTDDEPLAVFALCNISPLKPAPMWTGIRNQGLSARSLRTALVAASLGIAPLAASTAATPADNAMPLEFGAAASEMAVEIVPVVDAPLADLPDPASAPVTAEPTATSLGTGTASFYGRKFHGRRTASGEAFDMAAMTAAHRTLPFGSLVRVINPANGRSVTVRINDRGPFSRGRVIDVSRAAAEELGLVARGHGTVALELIED